MRIQILLLLGLGIMPSIRAAGPPLKPSSCPKPSTYTTTLLAIPTCADSVGNWPPSVPVNETSRPKNIGIVVFRAFEMLDVYGPLDTLGFIARMYPLNLYILSDTMDPVTTEPLLATMNPHNSSFFPTIQPTHTFANAPDLDVLIVPGGLGSRSPNLQEHIKYISEVYPSLQYIITVCTGAILAAKSGILDGRRATTNKAAFATVTQHGPKTTWVPKARWVVDGNIWTSSGVSAGIDATLAWVNHVYGIEDATSIANGMEYQAHKDASWDPFSDIYNLTETVSIQRDGQIPAA